MATYAHLDLARDTACHFLVQARRAGNDIAEYDGTPVAEAVIDGFGRRFVYAGIAPRGRDGRPDVTALRPYEFLVAPGIIYRWDESREQGAAALPGWLRRITGTLTA